MYPAELGIKDTTESITSAYLDLLLSIGRDGQLHTSIYDKRNDFNFHITNFPFLSSNITSSPAYGVFISQFIRYARACSSYECFILRARRLSSKLLKQGYLVERLKSSFRKFYGRYGDLIQRYEVSLSRMLKDILSLDQLQWLPNRSDFRPISWPWYRAWSSPNYDWFPWSILQRVWHASRERLPLRTSGSVPIACDPVVETGFPNLMCLFSTFYLDYPSLLSQFLLWASLMRNYLRPSGAPLYTLSKIIWCSPWFCNSTSFGAVYCLMCGRRRVAVARYRMICLVLSN